MCISLDNILYNFTNKNKNKFKTNKRDDSSLSILVDIPLSQSEKIQLGIRMENLLSKFILKNTHFKNIKEKTNIKNKKETDHLFIDKKNKIIYYAELKANLNLDTEKTKGTIKKSIEIKNNLKEKYKKYKIKMFLVGLRYINIRDMTSKILYKYKKISKNLVGINEYLSKLGIKTQKEFKNEKNYKKFLNKFVELLKYHN